VLADVLRRQDADLIAIGPMAALVQIFWLGCCLLFLVRLARWPQR
jgi:hypothetical protein